MPIGSEAFPGIALLLNSAAGRTAALTPENTRVRAITRRRGLSVATNTTLTIPLENLYRCSVAIGIDSCEPRLIDAGNSEFLSHVTGNEQIGTWGTLVPAVAALAVGIRVECATIVIRQLVAEPRRLPNSRAHNDCACTLSDLPRERHAFPFDCPDPRCSIRRRADAETRWRPSPRLRRYRAQSSDPPFAFPTDRSLLVTDRLRTAPSHPRNRRIHRSAPIPPSSTSPSQRRTRVAIRAFPEKLRRRAARRSVPVQSVREPCSTPPPILQRFLGCWQTHKSVLVLREETRCGPIAGSDREYP